MPDDDVSLAILRIAWRLDALDKWREQVDGRMVEFERGLRRVVEADKIGAAVADAMTAKVTDDRSAVLFGLTRRQVSVAFAGVLVAAVLGAVELALQLVRTVTGS